MSQFDPVQEDPLILAIDVQYNGNSMAVAAGVLFRGWDSAGGIQEKITELNDVAEYEPGAFYRREFPSLMAVLNAIKRTPDFIVVDSYVWLDGNRPGLGARLFDALGSKIPIIGVAKTRFHSASAIEVTRGISRSPLFVTSAGVQSAVAAEFIRSMHGPHRIPTLLRRVDQLCRRLVEPKSD